MVDIQWNNTVEGKTCEECNEKYTGTRTSKYGKCCRKKVSLRKNAERQANNKAANK